MTVIVILLANHSDLDYEDIRQTKRAADEGRRPNEGSRRRERRATVVE